MYCEFTNVSVPKLNINMYYIVTLKVHDLVVLFEA